MDTHTYALPLKIVPINKFANLSVVLSEILRA